MEDLPKDLRNAALPEDDLREMARRAADVIESQQRMLCLQNGVGVPTRDELMAALRRVEQLAHRYWTDQDVGPERTWGANLCEIIRTAPREARE